MKRQYFGKSNRNVVIINSENEKHTTKSVVIEDNLLCKINAGRVFTASADIESVADNASVYFLVKTELEKVLHLVFSIQSVGQWRFQSFLNPTITDNGTESIPFNRRPETGLVAGSRFYHDATILDEGIPRLSFRFGSGDRINNVSTAELRDDIESIFEDGDVFLMKLTNESSVASYLSLIGELYEEDKE